jgi:hypothetical protein
MDLPECTNTRFFELSVIYILLDWFLFELKSYTIGVRNESQKPFLQNNHSEVMWPVLAARRSNPPAVLEVLARRPDSRRLHRRNHRCERDTRGPAGKKGV